LLEPGNLPLASDGLPARETGAWVHQKNTHIEKYLAAFTKSVSKKWDGRLAYVELFSGPGRSLIRDTSEEVDGSPILALKCNFARYIFVDVPDVLVILRSRLANHPKLAQISFVEGNCNSVIDEVLIELPRDHLTLGFVDPTGLQIHFNTIRRLVHQRKIDLLMTLQFGMGVKMNLPQYLKTKEGGALSSFLGNSDWRQDAKESGTVFQLGRRILERYLSQLRGLGYLEVRDIEIIRNNKNMVLYFMVMASRHPLGEHLWREVTKIKPSGQRGFRFSSEE
jgi:three-Cys-motif partner protein